MKNVKFGPHTVPVPQPIEALVTRGAEALSKMSVEQRGELLDPLPTSLPKVSGGLAKRLLQANSIDLEDRIREHHSGLLKVSKGLVTDLQIASWLTQPEQAKPEMAEALAKMAVLGGVTTQSLDLLIARLEVIADIKKNGGMITLPLQARLNKVSTTFLTLLDQVRSGIEILAYAALQKKIDVPAPKA